MITNETYKEYNKLVFDICNSYKKSIPDEGVEDLAQTCWEYIIKQSPKYNSERGKMSTWITMICKSRLHNIIRNNKRLKRGGGTIKVVSIETLNPNKI